ncbi:GntR family transcriptional regulator [Brevibacillus sp. B_LB10_24]|uniref:GntR family transcriptional regulator n=1 Tax=Brevibacillus sp. B_LB10_24 TaxID=3380645 RepID=UPI0038B98BFB
MKKKAVKTAPMFIAEELATRIAKGILHPKEHLIETVIAEEFHTSRAPVREALLMLEKDRLVTRIPHHGFVVKKFSREEIHQLYDAVYRLEEIAMAKAIQHVDEEQIRRLDAILEKQAEAIEKQDIAGYYELNEEFHYTIFSIAQNEILTEMYQSLRRSARPLRMSSMAHGSNLSLSYQEHQEQVEALKQRNKEAAIAAIHKQEIRSLKTLDVLYPE